MIDDRIFLNINLEITLAMSQEANKFKKDNPTLNYKKMSLDQLNKLPHHVGIINFKISHASFFILNIFNDDSSAVKFFWKESHDLKSLDLWYEISKDEGAYIDVGAHTGLYTITSVKANRRNRVIAIEPFYLNMSRLINNLRLNNIKKNVDIKIAAASNFDGKANFKIDTDQTYLSKGGKIDEQGEPINTLKLDSLNLEKINEPIKGIKIDTEGEDLNVLIGSKEIIKNSKPKIIIEVREENKILIQKFFDELNYKLFDVMNLNNQINLQNINIKNVSNIYAEPIQKNYV